MADRLAQARQSRNADNEKWCYERTAGICEAKRMRRRRSPSGESGFLQFRSVYAEFYGRVGVVHTLRFTRAA